MEDGPHSQQGRTHPRHQCQIAILSEIGTDPTGFFNDEFYVGLHPYKDRVWKTGRIRNKEELIHAINAKLQSFPGIIFNYTQPAEDAVDEALTGLKSALAVKIYGPD